MNRGFNFGAGPATLPEAILNDVQAELLNWEGMGMSVLEVGHRTPEFKHLMGQAEQLLRKLLRIPSNYHVLFLGGAARTQFGMIPLNFLSPKQQAGYLITGVWSEMAFEEARRLRKAYCLASAADENYLAVPKLSDLKFKKNTTYIYYTPNETINGMRFSMPPACEGIPIVADMTSCLLAEPINITDYSLIFAGAQKNIANAGLTIVIVADDFVKTIANDLLPKMADYRVHITNQSLYATPPTFNCYLALKMFQWVEKQGGVQALYQINLQKAKALYDFIDASSFYHCKIAESSRSLYNVCFTLANPALEASFLAEAAKKGLLSLKGHERVGGLRASLYNAMPMEGVERLLDFMEAFAKFLKD